MTVTAKQLRKNSTDAERALWRMLRSRQLGGYKFRWQHPLGSFVVDFVCLESRLIVEVDGGQHNDTAQKVMDQARTDWLQMRGFRVLRFWDHEVLTQLDAVAQAIANALSRN